MTQFVRRKVICNNETRYTPTDPLGSVVLSASAAVLQAPPTLTVWLHARHGAGPPNLRLCPTLLDAGYVGPCWSDVVAGAVARTRYAPLIGEDDAVYTALEGEYHLTFAKEMNR